MTHIPIRAFITIGILIFAVIGFTTCSAQWSKQPGVTAPNNLPRCKVVSARYPGMCHEYYPDRTP